MRWPHSEATLDDSLPYGSYPIPQSAPERLAALARLHGLAAPDPSRCRLLELGCASGGNLIPLAARLPRSQLVGVDLSAAEIQRAEGMVAQLGLDNVRLYASDVAELGDSLGQFDFIIAHGLFSWVPPGVQDAILELIRRSLSPHGIAYLSYNVLPGWHLRRVPRDLIRLFGQADGDSAYQVAVARGSLEIFSEILPPSDAPYASAMHSELERLAGAASSYLDQEYLADHNEPFYAKEIFERFARGGLLPFADAFGFNPRLVGHADPMVRAVRDEVSDDWLEVDAYMDFVTNRSLRCTLLCHGGAALPEQPDPAGLVALHFASALTLVDGEPADAQGPARYRSPLGATLTFDDPTLKGLLAALESAWPDSRTFRELVSDVETALGAPLSAAAQRDVAGALLHAIGLTAIVALSAPRRARAPASLRAWNVARAYALSGSPFVPTLTHHAAPASALTRTLLGLLDGERDVQALVHGLTQACQAGAFGVTVRGVRLTGAADLTAFFADRVPKLLVELEHRGLMVAGP